MEQHSLPSNLLASVVVFLVALPLCMGIAIASGVSAEAGLISGIIGGLVVGLLAGSPLQVSGPAAGLVVIVWQIIDKFGVENFGAIVLGAGCIQLLSGVLGLGQWFRAVSPTVIYAMLSGIGVLIFGSQFHVMIDDVPAANGLQSLITIPSALTKSLSFEENFQHFMAASIGLLTICLLFVWERFRPEKMKMIPAALIGVTVSACIASVFALPINFVQIPDNFFGSISLVSTSSLGLLLTTEGMLMALSLAIVASAEALLCATAVDKIHTGVRTKYNQELIAQGVGNACCGLVGALPVTGVIVRSSANVDAGGTTRLSAVLHGVWIVLFIACFPVLLQCIPTSSLAALLVYIGYKLINWRILYSLAEKGKDEVAVFLLTVSSIVVLDLLSGIVIGVVATLFQLVYKVTHLSIEVKQSGEKEYVIDLEGAATFVSLPSLAKKLDTIPYDVTLHVHFHHLAYIDHACLELLVQWGDQATSKGGQVLLEWDDLHHYTERLKVKKEGSPAVVPEAIPDETIPGVTLQ